ncbi:MAG: hypothetical protein EOO73_07305 [Myxococcales bacterium]|nr:MAG: hypothetical protein EOO73_07305 [Myxococcales bacterium]
MRIRCVAWRPSPSAALAFRATVLVGLTLGCSDASHRLGGAYELSDGLRLGECAKGADLESIDRMEDADGTIDPIAGRSGVWLSWNDKTGWQEPSDLNETFVMKELDPPRGRSHFAASSRGGGFGDWGARIGFELQVQQGYDLSRYAGITFWARRGSGPAFVLRFVLPDRATTPRGKQCLTYACNDHFGVDLVLTEEFERYSFAWSDFEQIGWGEPKPSSLDAAAVYAVHFQIDKEQDFDFTVDDIALLCHPE